MADSLKDKIMSILENEAGVNLFFAMKQSDGTIKIKRADLQDGITQDHLKAQFISMMQEDFATAEDVQVLDLSIADERKDVLYRYDMYTFPQTLSYFSTFDYQNEYEVFKFNTDDLINLDAYIIVIGTQEKYCVLYKKFYPVFLLGRGSFCLIPSGRRFKEFEGGLLRVSKDYQFLKIDGDIYIKDLKVLEKFGGFSEIIEREATETVNMITEMGILEEPDGLIENLQEDIAFARKLCKVKRSSPIIAGGIPNETIIQFSKTHPGIAGKLRYSSDGTKILLTTKKAQTLFLKLLDDSFLISELTNLYYDSIAKEQVINL